MNLFKTYTFLFFLFITSCATTSLVTNPIDENVLNDLYVSKINIGYADGVTKDSKLDFLLKTEIQKVLGARYTSKGDDILEITIQGLSMVDKVMSGFFGAFAGGNELVIEVVLLRNGEEKGRFLVDETYNAGGYNAVVNIQKNMAQRATRQIKKILGL